MGMKILVVGCGGLGCELIKILASDLTNDITIIDDDTIDLTNLNRQFFFVKSDINKSKSEIVCKKIVEREQHPNCSFIFDRIDNYKKLEYYKQFDIVFNCLDNDSARSFVNQRCLLANVRMIDGGSAGWLGQSFCNSEECFDCIPKQTEKIYPVCSIRQRPKNFEHCLIWAKAIAETMENLEEEINELENVLENLSNSESYESGDSDLALVENKFRNDRKRFKRGNIIDFDKEKFISEVRSLLDLHQIIYKLACLKADLFSVEKFSFLNSQTFLRKIIPSICTTNSIVASLMVLSSELSKNFYLVQGSIGILKVDLNEKKKDCLVCSIPTYRAIFVLKSTISSFLNTFNGETLSFNTTVFNLESTEDLIQFDGDIMICMRNGLPNRIYFELGEEELIQRIR